MRHVNALKFMYLGLALAVSVAPAWAADSVCANLPGMDHPHVTISNGKVDAVVMLPDKDNGFNRGSRSTGREWSSALH